MARKQSDRPKTVLITGCTPGGIGDALLHEFQSKGHTVYATLRNFKDHPNQVSEDDNVLPKLTWLPLDVTDPNSISKCVNFYIEMNGGEHLDILVNNAGIGYSIPLLDANIPQARKVFDVNYFGVLSVIQAFAPLLINSKGRIVNISSVAQFAPVPWLGVYNSSKSALAMLSDTLRLELSPFDVKVINVVTGGVRSNMNDNNIKGTIALNSFYHPAKEAIERVIGGELSLKHQTGTTDYAQKVVKHVLSKNPSSQFFAGDKSTSLWLLDTFTWHTVWNLIFPRMAGISALKRNLKLTDGPEEQKETPNMASIAQVQPRPDSSPRTVLE